MMIPQNDEDYLPKNKQPRCLMDRRDTSSSSSSIVSSKISGNLGLETSGTIVARIALRKNARSGWELAMRRLPLIYFEHHADGDFINTNCYVSVRGPVVSKVNKPAFRETVKIQTDVA
jgi:hypothetical protein